MTGYWDDFTFDFGWTVSGSAETGEWERGVPNSTTNTVMGYDSEMIVEQKHMLRVIGIMWIQIMTMLIMESLS